MFVHSLSGAQPLDRSPAGRAARARVLAADFQTALGLAAAGNVTAAEATLFARNVQSPNSLAWDIEAATKLTHLALGLRARLAPGNSIVVARRALALLNDGISNRGVGARPVQRAQAYETAAYIYERLLFDRAAAKTALNQAQLVDPSSRAAATALGRIRDLEDAELHALGKKG